MTGARDAFKGDWRRDLKSWRPAYNTYFEQQDSTEVRVVSWGPGEGSPHHEKRQEICRDLATRSANNVFTPEQLSTELPRFQELEDNFVAEEIQAGDADIIICLVVDDPASHGAPAEIVKFGDHPRVGPKIRLLLPKEPPPGLLYQSSEKFPSGRTFRYSRKQYKQCAHIRAKCHQWVEEVRRSKHLEHWRKERDSG